MSTSSSLLAPLPPGIERGKKYRFVVRSAEEAISTLKERLGEEAKVLSVKQIDGQGLSKFLNSPKLEIIATIPEAEAAAPAAPPPQVAVKTAARQEQPPAQPVQPAAPSAEAVAPQPDEDLAKELEEPTAGSRVSRTYGRNSPSNRSSDIWTVLRKAGFAEPLLNSLHYGTTAGKLEDMPLPRALSEINRRLRQEYGDVPERALTDKIAFFGTPGVGKTTALCKRLAHDVFIERKNIEVLKLDSETPNPDDALSVFCDVLGVPLQRDPVDPGFGPSGDILYLDLPGVPLHEQDEWRKLRSRLDVLKVETRVLVIHALYEADLIGAAYDLGERMGATHVVLTHMDELSNGTKLWPYILRGGLTPLFVSHGQNVTSDYSVEFLRALLERTFPSTLIS